jgi:hypothetical protein
MNRKIIQLKNIKTGFITIFLLLIANQTYYTMLSIYLNFNQCDINNIQNQELILTNDTKIIYSGITFEPFSYCYKYDTLNVNIEPKYCYNFNSNYIFTESKIRNNPLYVFFYTIMFYIIIGIINKKLQIEISNIVTTNIIISNNNLDIESSLIAIPIDNICDLKDHLQCSICVTHIKNMVLNCGHQFCSDCVQKFDPKICPSCRTDITNIIHCY